MSGRARDHDGRGRLSSRDYYQRRDDRMPSGNSRRLRPETIMMDEDFNRQPEFKIQIVQPNVTDHAARCAVCIRKVPDILHHCNSRHLPWFVNAHTACGACYMQYNTVSSLKAHIEAHHRHENAQVKPQLWAVCMNEFFGMIADVLRIDVNAIPQFVREHRLANHYQPKQKNMISPDSAIYFLEPTFSGPEPFNPENPRSLRDCSHWKIIMRLIAVSGGEVGTNLVRCVRPEQGYMYYPETAADREEQRKNNMFKRLGDGTVSRFSTIPRHAEHPPNLNAPREDRRESGQRSSTRERLQPQDSSLANQIVEAVSIGAIKPDALPQDIGILLTDLVRGGNSADPKIIKELAARTNLGKPQRESSSNRQPRDEASKRAHRDDSMSHRAMPNEPVPPPTKRTKPSRFDNRDDRRHVEEERLKYPDDRKYADERQSDGCRYVDDERQRAYAEEVLRRQTQLTRNYDNLDGRREHPSDQRYNDERYREEKRYHEEQPGPSHRYKDERQRERVHDVGAAHEYPTELAREVIRRYMEEEPHVKIPVPGKPPKAPSMPTVAADPKGYLVPSRSAQTSDKYLNPSEERYRDERGRYPPTQEEIQRFYGETKASQETRQDPIRKKYNPPPFVPPPPRPAPPAAPEKRTIPDIRDLPTVARNDRYDRYAATTDRLDSRGAVHARDLVADGRARNGAAQLPGPSRVREHVPTDRKDLDPSGSSQQEMQQQLKTLSQGMSVLTDAIMQMNSLRK